MHCSARGELLGVVNTTTLDLSCGTTLPEEQQPAKKPVSRTLRCGTTKSVLTSCTTVRSGSSTAASRQMLEHVTHAAKKNYRCILRTWRTFTPASPAKPRMHPSFTDSLRSPAIWIKLAETLGSLHQTG